jgi:Ca2+-binding RTX toxin-like protein
MASVAGTSQHDSLLGSEGGDTLLGYAGADTLTGGSAADVLFGGEGNDVLFGHAGGDSLHGHQGNDILFGGEGGDTLYGGQGDDTITGGANITIAILENGVITYRNSALVNDDLLSGDLGDDLLQGTTGNDTLAGGDGNDTIRGGRDNDSAAGGKGDDSLFGDKGNDTLQGNQGSDVLQGGTGNDLLRGGQGDDILIGGDGQDTLYGDLSGESGDTIFTGNGNDLVIIRLNDPTPVLGLAKPASRGLATVGQTAIVDFSSGDRIQFEGASIHSLHITNSPTNTAADFSTLVTINDQQFILHGVTASQISSQNSSQGTQIVFAGGSSGGGSSGGGGSPPPNVAPLLADISATTAYTQNAAATVIDGSATITDADDTNIDSAQVWISAGGDFVAGGGIDALNFTNQNGITGSYDANTGILMLTGSATKADYETALESVTFSSTSATTGDRTISFKVNDGAADSNTLTATITYSLANVAPVLADIGNAATYTENAAASVIDTTITITDGNDTHIESATVVITGNYTAGDRLNFTNQNGITGIYAAGTLTLTGSATKADWETALESITFDSTSDAPTNATRTISFTINDGDVNSNTQTATVAVTPTSDISSTAFSDLESLANNAWAGLNSAAVTSHFTSLSTITYTLTQSDITGAAYAGFTINSSTGAIAHTGNLPNANQVYVLTVTGTDAEGFASSQTFELWAHVGALTYTGTTGNDTQTSNTRVWGNDGNDSISINAGATLHGGSGDDTLLGITGSTTDIFYGGAGDDSVTGHATGGVDTFYGGSGNDTIAGRLFADSLIGGTGVDYFTYTGLTDSQVAGRDTITDFSQSDGDKIWMQAGFDKVYAGDGTANDTAIASIEVGNLVWYQSGGNTFVYDPMGSSTFSIQLTGLIALTAADFIFASGVGTATAGNDTISGAGVVSGLAGDDSITSTSTATVNGGDGDDTINSSGGGPARVIFGGAGNDTIHGETGADTIVGGSGIDTLHGHGGTDVISGGAGADYFAYRAFSASTVSGRDTITDFNQGDGDKLWIQNGFDKVYAGDGTANDTGIAGVEVGNLVWYQSGGNTFIYDPMGSSTFSIQLTGLIALTSADFIFAGTASSLSGTAGNDTISGQGGIIGLAGDDSITATSGSSIGGGEGNDTITGAGVVMVEFGGAGDDSLMGNTGADSVYGGSGDDTLQSGGGADRLVGGTGVDYFTYTSLTDSQVAGRDSITDFSQGDGDKIWMQAGFDKLITGGSGMAATDSVLAGFEVGNLVTYQSGGNTFVYDPSGASTFSIQLTGLITLIAADFIFASGVGTATAGNDTISGAGVISGLAGDDSITGSGATVNGGDGNDTVTGSVNLFLGGSGNDSISSDNAGERLFGGGGDDTLYGNNGADSLTGGAGADYYVYRFFTTSTVAARDTITDFSQSDGDRILMQAGFDKIITGGSGTAATDSVLAGFEVGNLVTYQSGGNTFVYDPSGSSTFSIQLTGLISLVSGDFIFASAVGTATAGNDTISGVGIMSGLAGDDSISTTNGSTVNGGDGNDTIVAPSGGASRVYFGGTGDDSLSTFTTAGWNDTLFGGSGNDTLFGYQSQDSISGGTGGDSISGGHGVDSIAVGFADSATDTVVYSASNEGAAVGANTGMDTISEFEVGTDKIAFTSTLNTNFDDIANDDVITWQTNAAAIFTAPHEALHITGLADADLTQAGFTNILAALNGYGITAASGADAIIAVQGATQTAFFFYTENGTLANNIVAGELTLLGVTNGQLTTADFIFA